MVSAIISLFLSVICSNFIEGEVTVQHIIYSLDNVY